MHEGRRLYDHRGQAKEYFTKAQNKEEDDGCGNKLYVGPMIQVL